MSADNDNLVLEMLRKIRASQERTEFDLSDLKVRVSSLEQQQGQIITLLGAMNHRMDRFDERMSRVERRLDLVDA